MGNLIEKYKRPCLAVCDCGRRHGVIIFKDGSESVTIVSKEQGKKHVNDLVKEGKLTKDDGQRIEDQINASDLYDGPSSVPRFVLLALQASKPDHSRN